MIKNMPVKTGKVLEEWIRIVKHEQFSKHREIVQYLKDEYLLTHGYASLIAHKSKNND